MKGKFDAYVLWPSAKMIQIWIVDRSTARDFTVFKLLSNRRAADQLNIMSLVEKSV